MRSACIAGVTVERFWQLTPAEVLIEIEAWEKRKELDDFRVGLLCAVISEPHRDPKKRKDPFTPQDFMPTKQEGKKQTVNEQLEIIKVLNAAMGGEIVVS